MGEPASDVALRRGVLAVSVLDDIDLVPMDDGVRLDRARWPARRSATGPADPDLEGEARLAWEELAAAVGSVGP